MKISKSCYVIYGLTTIPPWMVNSGFIVGNKSTLIVDCGPNYLSAQTIYGYAKCAKPDNKIFAINTEPHFDHMGGNCLFRKKGIDIYGHYKIKRTEEDLATVKKEFNMIVADKLRRNNKEGNLVFFKTEFANPNIPISKDISIDLGDLKIEIVLTPGHTKMNISVFVPSEGILYCGDAIVNGYFPNLEDGDVNDWKTWLDTLTKIEKINPRNIVSGHGEVMQGDQIFNEIDRIKNILIKAIN